MINLKELYKLQQDVKEIKKGDGIVGPEGKSAYQVALDNGFIGTAEDWLRSLKGDQGDQGVQGIQGIQGAKGERGAVGASAYDIAISNGFSGSTQEWLESIKGNDGNPGPVGPKGADGLTTSIQVNGSTYNHINGKITLPNYPTLGSLGALPLTGGTLTGRLTLTNSSVNPAFGTSVKGDISASSMQDGLSIIDSGQAANGYRSAYSTILNVKSSIDRQFQLCVSNNGFFSMRVSHSDASSSNKWKNWIDLYTTENKPTWADINGKPSTFPPTIGTASNQAAAGNHTHNDKANTNLVSSVYKRFDVGGDANTYYPVVIRPTSRSSFGFYTLNVSRVFNWKAPDTWYNSTHKGGLTLCIEWSGETVWGGNDQDIRVREFHETYSTMVGGLSLSTEGLVVWLRGGGATYQVDGSYGNGYNVTVKLEGFTGSNDAVYSPRSNTDKTSSEVLNRQCLRYAGKVYDTGNRVYSPVNKPTAADIGAAASSHTHNYLPLTGGTLSGNLTLVNKAVNPSFGTSIAGNSSAGDLSPGLSIIDTGTEENGYAYTYGTVLNVNAGSLTRQYQLLMSGTGHFSVRASHSNNSSANKWTNWYKVYTELDKPTANDVKALPLTGGALTGELRIQGSSVILNKPVASGPWARGIQFRSTDNTTDLGSIGMYGTGDTTENMYIGFAPNAYTGATGITITKSDLKFKNNKVYHAGDKPTWNDITGKPSTFAPIIGTASNQAAAGNHTHDSVSGTQITADIYNYANGVLINTNQLSAQSTMVTVRIIGNGYGAGLPIDCTYCFYDYNADSVIMNPSGVATGVPITLSVFRHDGKLKMWFKQTVAYQSFKIIVTFGNKENTTKPTFSDAPMPTSGVTNKIDIVPKTFLQTAGGTLTGALTLNSTGLRFPTTAGTWLSGKTTNNAILITGNSSNSYHPILRYNHNSGYVSSFGALGNRIGIWGYAGNRTENGTDAGAYLDVGTNTFFAGKFDGDGTSIRGVNAARLNGLTETMTSAPDSIAKRDGNGDISARLLRSEYANQSNISGAIAFRVNNSNDNYVRFCSDPAAVRTWLGAAASSHGTHVSYGGNGSASTVSRSDHTHSYVPLSGGTMSGEIQMNGKQIKLTTLNSAHARIGIEASSNDVYISNYNNNWLRLKPDLTMTFGGHKVYTSKEKPTPSEIGAAASSHTHYLSDITGTTLRFDKGVYIRGLDASSMEISAVTTHMNHIRLGAEKNIYLPNNFGIAGKDYSGVDRYMLFMDASNRIHIGYNKINNVIIDANTLELSGCVRTTTESRFSDGRDYVDPWYGKTCCIKGVGDAAISGWINVSQHVFKGWAFTNGNKYWVGMSADDLHLRSYHGNSDLASGAMNLGSSNCRWLGLFVVNPVNVSSDIRKKKDIVSCCENEKLETFYDNLKPCSYAMKAGDSGRSHFGFIAQEVEDAMDTAGMSYNDCAFLQKAPLDENGDEIRHYTLVEDPNNPGKYVKKYNITDHETDERIKDYDYALAYTELISVNTHFIQNLRSRVKELEDKNKSLEERLERLENLIVNM